MRLFVHFMKEQHSLLAAQNEARLHEWCWRTHFRSVSDVLTYKSLTQPVYLASTVHGCEAPLCWRI